MSGGEVDTLLVPDAGIGDRCDPSPGPEERPGAPERLERRRAYWRRELAGAPLGLELPVDRPRPATPNLRGADCELRLPAAVAAHLRQAARRAGATLQELLLAAFAALLSRYSGADDLLIGLPAAEDPARPLPLRLRWGGDPPFVRLLAATRETVLAVLAHREEPLAELAAELWPEHDPSRGLPLQVLFAWQGAGSPPLPVAGPGLSLAPAVDLTLWALEPAGREGPLALGLRYAMDLFTAATAARLCGHFATLLGAAVAAADLPLSRLPLLAAAERHQLLVEWNDTAADLPPRSLHRLFEEQAAARPAAVAVEWDGGSLTYAGLDRQAGRIARRLRRLGVKPEARVALYMERSAAMVAAVLGILKAGGAYLPIDPSYPRERLEMLLTDAAPAAIVGMRRQLAALGGPSEAIPRLALEDLETTADALDPGESASVDISPAGLAYVLYTSGSTGKPNGVEVSHRAVIRLVRETGYLPFGPDEVFLQMALMSFDAATLELWGPLLNGGRLALAPPGRYVLRDLYATLRRHQVTSIFLTTGLFHVAVEEGREGTAGFAGLRHLIAGGDAVSRSHVDQALAALPQVDLINAYGPTENTTFSTTYRFRDGAGEQPVPIGRPIANGRAYVLDRNLEPVPVGCAGELFLEGVGLARGYLERRELTAERFVPDPLGDGGRLYRTGDLVRWRADGTLAFLGRRDFQVKVRGFRIEPAEIETALLGHPRIREAAVVGLAEGGRDHRVVAYYVAAEAPAAPDVTPGELRTFLRARLPEHMVPSAFVALAALPLTPIGKLDRRALPPPEERPLPAAPAHEGTAGLSTTPRDPVEELVAALWTEVLEGSPRLGVHDSFFDLGGHSLSAIRLLARIRQTLGVELGIQTLFAFPTVSGLTRVVTAARQGTAAGELPPLVAAPRQGPLALSFAQRRLWFLDRLAPGSPLYNVPAAWLLRGAVEPMEPARLAAALAEIARRHESLRTRFVEVDGEPRQEIDPPRPVPLPEVDLRSLAGERRERELARLRSAEARRPFDLARGPLLRAALVRLDDRERVLLLTVHHVVYDGWSEGILARELPVLYAAALVGRPSPLPALAVQYADFAAWQRAWPPAVLVRQLAYWRGELAGAPTALELPADRPRPPVQSFRGARRLLHLPAAATAELQRAARQEGTTLYMLLLASFAALLMRHTGEEDPLVGTPVADRTRPEIEGVIGFFVNTLALRVRLAGDPELRGLLAAVRDTVLGAFAHPDLPFEALVEELKPERDLSRNPLVQVLLAFQGAGQGEAPGEAGLRLERLPLGAGTTAKFDLSLSVMELPDGGGETALALALEYATDLFTAATAERLLAHFATLVAGAAAAPELPLSQLPLLAAPERHQLVAEWNDVASGFPPRAVHELFAEQASAQPDAVALAWEGGALTYGELDRRAGRIARRLARLGVRAGARVGLAVERSAGMVEAILGILKVGGAYLPLDPSYPRERLEYLLADAAPSLIVGTRSPLASMPGTVPHLDLEAADDAEPGAVRLDAVSPEGIAYVLYTSGSTGRPKGVEVTHRGIVRLVGEDGYAEFGPGEVWLQHSPLSFDAATPELWGPLLHGGCLVLLRPGPFSLGDVYAAAARHGVTTLFLPTGLFHVAMEESRDALAALPALHQLLAGGDVMSRPHLDRALEALPRVDVVNCYGPTENTTCSTAHRVRGGTRPGPGPVAIGRPVANSPAHVLDRALGALPIGCAGELYVGGPGLARGYLGRPGLTAASFVPDPFGGGRLYRTGDLARWRPDGALEFLGRRDFQVKVRGFRLEPGEVESALLGHRQVREAVVVALAEAAQDHRLVAYYAEVEDAARPAGALTPAELRAFLRERLPEHLVPSAFVRLESLPLTPHGKLDRRALPAPAAAAGAGDASSRQRTAPRTPLEEVIAGIWEDVLGLDRGIGVDESFFHLGGHSLLAIRLLSRLRQALHVDLPVRQLFEEPTITGLAAAVEAQRQAAAPDPATALPPLVPLPGDLRENVLSPLSHQERRLWFLARMAPASPAYNIPAGFLLRGALDRPALAAALTAIVRRHEILRTRFVEQDGEPWQQVEALRQVPLPLIDLGGLADESGGQTSRQASELARLRAEEAARPFDLARGPLLRAGLIRLSAEDHALLLTLHHIVYDGWSEGVLLGELWPLYAAARARQPSPLAAPALQYADYAAWQRSWPPAVLAEQLAYWRRELAGAPAILDLPADRPRPAVASFRGASRRRYLPAPQTALLRQTARRHGTTLYMLILAGFAALLARWTGEEDLLIGTPVANRTRPELEGMIGFFVNTLALRSRLAGDPDFRHLLAATRDTALAAFAHQDLPFETLVEELRPERAPSRSPLVQVLMSLDNAGRMPAAAGSGLRLARLPFGERTTAKLDLSLAIGEVGEAGGGGERALALELEYAADLFTAATAERLLAHYITLVAGAAAAPDLPLSRLPLLAESERHQLAAEWNDTASAFPRRTLHALFAAQAAARPEAIALEWEGGSLTYGALARRAGRIALALARLGVGPEARVALLAERSAEMVAAVLGILQAGGAYLPLDPSSPRERLELLLADAAPAAIVTQGGPRALPAAALAAIPRLELEDLPAIPDVPAGAEAGGREGSPDGLAYVLYTSGSTGTPKGVEVGHRAVVRLVRETGYAAFGPGEVFLQMAPMAFDAATLELWGPLLHGGRLALFRPGPFALGDLFSAVARHGVTTLWLTAGLFHLAVEEGLQGLGGLRQLLAGGDVLSRAHVLRALAALPGVELINGYGPTENTTLSATHRLRGGLSGSSVPIGRPIASSRTHVLDRALEPLPVGCPGDLYVGGDGLARGYLGRPELTAESFVPDPFGGGRLYRTGDRARWRPDGTLEFLGRRDLQVKVRGFRIEPGEIESVLLRHPQVREAAVVARAESGPGEPGRRLVAFYSVAAAAGDVTPGTLRDFLHEHLPEPMVPSVFVRLDSLPLTPSGKVDRRALPAPAPDEEPGLGSGPVRPRTPHEELIAGIWEDVLDLDRPIGIDESFFHLGGHSLLAIRLLSRLRQALGVELPVQQLFESPTIAGLAAAAAASARESPEVVLPPLVPLAQRDGVLPLSYPQQRLWFMDRLAPDSPTYNIPSGYRLRGALDPAALAAALSEIVRRHEVLRTRIAVVHGQPGQEICPPSPLPLPLPRVDLGGLPPERRDLELARLGREEARRTFNLLRGPMLRAALLRLEGGEHVLLLTLHHIASDGWSEGVLLRELAALYAAALARQPSPLADLAFQYADFAAWQRAWPDEVLAAQIAYWREKLAGTPVLEIPTDRPRPAVQSFRGDTLELDLPPALPGALRHLARRGQATVFMILLAAWHALLQRLSGQADFAVGTPVANRTRPEIEPLVGLFLNMLVLRPDASEEPAEQRAPSFAGLLARVRGSALAAYDHADVPFERLVDELKPVRDLSRQPLLQTMLALNSTPAAPFALPGLAVSRLPLAGSVSRFDVSLGLLDRKGAGGDHLAGQLEYSTDLFDRASMMRLAGHFINVLAAVVADPGCRLVAIDLLSAAERQQLAVELNDTATLYAGGDACLHHLIATQAAQTPDAVAVLGEEEALTYGELAARAHRLARRLRQLGVGVDQPVAISAERSPALLVGLLAILSAGGAYLPLDPSYPPERLAFMIEDGLTGLPAPVLLAEASLVPRLAGAAAAVGARLVDLVDLDTAAALPGEAGASADPVGLTAEPSADNLAYVIYTSGSTGKPKGVMNSHRGIVNRLLWMRQVHGLGPADRVLQKTPLSFDVSVWELFAPLIAGARLVLARPGGQREPAYLLRRIVEQEVTVAHFVPTMLQLFLEQPDLDRCRSLWRVIASGEALPLETERRFAALLDAELHNLYGPTEAAVEVTTHLCMPISSSVRTVPIGRPLANLSTWLLDAGLEPVPLGVPAELFLGGVGLARGYLGRPDLTAERFVPHPLGRAGERLYRTGDLARHLPDGEIEFLGRTDDQVKLRGFRVEPGEIEAALTSHPGVLEAAVVAREERPGKLRLAGYWVATATPPPAEADLRQALRRTLPEHMVPADLVLLEALPLTPSGKLDRQALRTRIDARPVEELASSAEPPAEPETELEALLVAIWEDLLGRAPIDIRANLFDLGAHSLLALQFTARVQEALDLELPLHVLFEFPTVQQLALAVEDALLAQIESLTDEEAAEQVE